MDPNIIVLSVAAVAGVAAAVRTRIRRGRRLLVLRDRPSALRWVLGGVCLAMVAFDVVAHSGRPGRVGSGAGILAMLAFTVSDLGLFFGPRPSGRCVFHENGLLVYDGRNPQFTDWSSIERYEWQGDMLVFHLVPEGLAHVGAVLSYDVPLERRGEVMNAIAGRVRG
jgi:hypothetical protein